MNRTAECDKYVTPDWVMYGFYGLAFVMAGIFLAILATLAWATWNEVRKP